MRSCLSRRNLHRAVGVTVGSLDATLGPRRFFFPIRAGGGGSHFGFCFCKHGQRFSGRVLVHLYLCRPCLFHLRECLLFLLQEGDLIGRYPTALVMLPLEDGEAMYHCDVSLVVSRVCWIDDF